ncbi:AAA family ATPase [Deinococcus antarcticus]|uniref:AAA family ATPase n=1 Tax=Deinococcus antarcticus TaxID=1298767 RepID=A0ABV8A6R4_9DEIO
MTTIHLLVGLPGAGKTTLARQLEAQHAALRLTPDEWMQPLFGAGESDDKRAVLEHDLLWSVAKRVLTLGVDVVLDFGLWFRPVVTPGTRPVPRQSEGTGRTSHALRS